MKRHPGAFTTWPGRFIERDIGPLRPPGAIQKQNRKKHKHASHTATSLQQQQVLIMSHPSSTEKAPSTDKSTDDQSNSWVSLRRPGRAAPTMEGTRRRPVPRLRPRLLRSRSYSADHSLALSTFLCKAHPYLLRKQLHSPHSNDLLAPPRGVHPQKTKGGGAFTVFLLNEGALTPEHARFR